MAYQFLLSPLLLEPGKDTNPVKDESQWASKGDCHQIAYQRFNEDSKRKRRVEQLITGIGHKRSHHYKPSVSILPVKEKMDWN